MSDAVFHRNGERPFADADEQIDPVVPDASAGVEGVPSSVVDRSVRELHAARLFDDKFRPERNDAPVDGDATERNKLAAGKTDRIAMRRNLPASCAFPSTIDHQDASVVELGRALERGNRQEFL